jgi:hypothetical protein
MADVAKAGIELGAPRVRTSRVVRSSMAPISAMMDGAIDDERLFRALTAWATLIGQISLELFGHLGGGVLDYDAHFRQVVSNVADDLGLPK